MCIWVLILAPNFSNPPPPRDYVYLGDYQKKSFSLTDIFQEKIKDLFRLLFFGGCSLALPQPFPTKINLCPHLPYGGR